MKVLLIQLARYGDLLMTAPVVEALHSAGHEIAVVVRRSYAEPLVALRCPCLRFELDLKSWLEPALIGEDVDNKEALSRVEDNLNVISDWCPDRIVNLTFSPLSASITQALGNESLRRNHPATLSGYARHADGTLSLVGAASQYFYAHVGPGKSNRLHLTDIFAWCAEAPLLARPRELSRATDRIATDSRKSRRILLHIAASDAQKTLSSSQWAELMDNLEALDSELIAIGAASEKVIAAEISSRTKVPFESRVGYTTWADLKALFEQSDLLICGDSGPMHLASLLALPTLCVTSDRVNFWETGPRSPGSRVIGLRERPSSQKIAAHVREMLAGENTRNDGDCAYVADPDATPESELSPLGAWPIYQVPNKEISGALDRESGWPFVEWIWAGGQMPTTSEVEARILKEAGRVNDVARQQIRVLRANPRHRQAASILEAVDETLSALAKFSPRTRPLFERLNSHKVAIEPGSLQNLINDTGRAHEWFGAQLNQFIHPTPGGQNGHSELDS